MFNRYFGKKWFRIKEVADKTGISVDLLRLACKYNWEGVTSRRLVTKNGKQSIYWEVLGDQHLASFIKKQIENEKGYNYERV